MLTPDNAQNEVERAFAGMLRGPEGRPEFFRQLRAATLTFLMPYHPEMEGMMGVEGSGVPPFSVWKNPKGKFIPVFTSLARAEQALKATGAKDKMYCVAEMNGAELFRLVAHRKEKVAINPACGTGEIYLNRDAARLLGDGSILKPIQRDAGPPENRGMKIVAPADYPTAFLQPLFQFLRGRPEARAGWLFTFNTPKPPLKVEYGFLLVASRNWEQLKQDFAVVAHSLCMDRREMYFGVQVTHPDDPAIANVLAPMHPFFTAPDYQMPGPQAAQGKS